MTWNCALRVRLLLYNCTQGIVARIAQAPWGPRSQATVILSSDQDDSPCRLLMTEGGCGNQKRYHDQSGPVPAGFYAPCVMERYTTPVRTPLLRGKRQATVYWLLSTWNPYQVAVMRTTLNVWDTRITDKVKLMKQKRGKG